MKKLFFLFTIALFVLVIAIDVRAQEVAGITAIKAGRLVDPETGTTRENQTILIENGKVYKGRT